MSRRTPGGSDITRISIEPSITGPFSNVLVEARQQEYAKFDHSSSKFSAADFLTIVDKVCRSKSRGARVLISGSGNKPYGDS